MTASDLSITRTLPSKGKSSYAPTTLEVNGVDISNAVMGYTLTHEPSGEVTCALNLAVGHIAAHVGVENVRVDDNTAEALAALGYVRKDDVINAARRAEALAEVSMGDPSSSEMAADIIEALEKL